MVISPGFTAAEIREFVHEYQAQPHGGKKSWLASRGVSYDRFRRWREAVFAGDVDRGLIPRQGGGMSVPPGRLTAWERQRAAERAAHEAELARLNERVHELEETNEALGKAIGLLHEKNAQGPAVPPETNDPSGS